MTLTLKKYIGYAHNRTLPKKKRRGPFVLPDCPNTKVLSTKVFDSPAAFIETNFNLILPNVQEDWQKRVSSLLFCLEKLDDVLVTVLSGQVQWSFSISVCWLQVYTAL